MKILVFAKELQSLSRKTVERLMNSKKKKKNVVYSGVYSKRNNIFLIF
jgi:hypothetical protein